MSNQISEEAPAKEKASPAAAQGGVEENSDKTIRQAVYDIRYRARREELDLRHAFSQYMGSSNLNQQEKTAVQEKLFGKEGGGGAPAEQAESLAVDSIINAMHKVFSENKTCCKKCGSYDHTTKECTIKEDNIAEGNPVQKAWNKFVPPPSQSANPNVRSGKLTPGKLESGALKTLNKTAENINKPIKATAKTVKTVKSTSNAVKGAVDTVAKGSSKVTKAVTGAAKKVASAASKNPKTAALVAGGALAAGLAGKAIADRKKKKKKTVKESASEQKYKVRVQDKEKPSYVRYADRDKINQLRSNPQISSVEMTGHGDPYEGDKSKKASTSSIKQKGKKDEVSGKDNKIDLKKEEVTNEALQAIPMVAGKVALAGAKVAGKAAVGGAKLAGKAAVGGARLAGKAAAKTAKVAGKTAVKVGKKVGKVAVKQAKSTAMGTANNAYKVGKAVVNRSGRAAKGAIKGALSNEEYLADGNITAPPTNKKITGEKVDNSKLIKVFPQDGSDPQIGNIKSSYKPVGQVVSEILSKEAYTVTAADKKGNTPAYQAYKAGKKNVKTGEPLYKAADHLKNEGVEVKMEGDDDTPATVDALLDTINSKNNDDSRAMYTKWNLAKNKMRAAGLKMSYTPEGEMTEGKLKSGAGSLLGGIAGGAAGLAAGGPAGAALGATAGSAAGAALGAKKGRKGSAAVGGAVGGPVGAAIGASYEPEGEMTEGIVGKTVGGVGKATGKVVGGVGKVTGKVVGGVEDVAGKVAVGGVKTGAKVAGSVVKRTGRAVGGAISGALSSGKKEEVEFTGNNVEEGVLGAASGAVLGGAVGGLPGAVAGGALGSKVDVLGGDKKSKRKRLKKEGYTNVVEDIADILARLEKKRISKGGNPDESPLGKKTGRAMKSQQDKVRKKAGLKTEHHQKDADGNTVPHEDGVICESNLVRSIISKKN